MYLRKLSHIRTIAQRDVIMEKIEKQGMKSEMKGPKYIISKPPKGENGGKTMI